MSSVWRNLRAGTEKNQRVAQKLSTVVLENNQRLARGTLPLQVSEREKPMANGRTRIGYDSSDEGQIVERKAEAVKS